MIAAETITITEVRLSNVLSRQDRALYYAAMLCATLVLRTAGLLTPSTRGIGTHTQLGLPACTFLRLTGIPCPSCGLTTSFAYAARFDFARAFLTQPFGAVLFGLTVLAIPLTVVLLMKQIPVETLTQTRAMRRAVQLLLCLYALGWMYKIVVMVR